MPGLTVVFCATVSEAYCLAAPMAALRESLKTTQKRVEGELKQCVAHIQRLKGIATAEQASRSQLHAELNALENTLLSLRSQLVAASALEAQLSAAVQARSQFVARSDSVTADRAEAQLVLDRLVVDFLLRCGHARAARQLAEQANVVALCDFELFDEVHRILDALRRRDCAPALLWCAAHRAQLAKLPAELDVEFDFRAQEFLALVRAGARRDALAYARLWFPAHAERRLASLQRTMTCLAFDPDTQHPRYRPLFDEHARFADLARRFFRAAMAVAGAPATAPLLVYTTAALATLKTTACTLDGERSDACPACHEPLRPLAAIVPVALRQQSFLLCRMSGAVMGDDNPPLALPNGNVYSTSALTAQAAENGGRVRDMRTGEVFTLEECVKLHVV